MRPSAADYVFITPLNAVRFLAAVAIVVFHYGRWSWPFSLAALQPYVLNANNAVSLFFVLSGFIMVHVYGHKLSHLNVPAIKRFYLARIARIVPLYLAALLMTVWALIRLEQTISLRSLLLQIFFLQSWVPQEPLRLNFTGWSLSVEMLFYALFPFLFRWMRNQTWNVGALITAAIWLFSNALTAAFIISSYPHVERADVIAKFYPLLHVNAFLVGMSACLWMQQSKKKLPRIFLIASAFILFLYPLVTPASLRPLFHNGLLAPIFAVLLITLAQTKNVAATWLSARPFVIGGDISYGIYILQVPVYLWAYDAYRQLGIFDTLHEEGRFFLYLILLCAASWISLVTLERYAKKWIRGNT